MFDLFTRILLRRLQCDPDLASVSHVFVDEVHERDLNTDFMLVILRDLLQRRKSLKLVLMSATLNAERFSNYFGGCPTVSIPGRAQPVKEYRWDDFVDPCSQLMMLCVVEPSLTLCWKLQVGRRSWGDRSFSTRGIWLCKKEVSQRRWRYRTIIQVHSQKVVSQLQ